MISFCGVPLLLHDPEGNLQDYLNRVLAEEEIRWCGQRSPAEASLQQTSLQRHPFRVPMPCFNWPARPQPRINSLYLPVTGATRWSLGLFLVDGTSFQTIAGKLTAQGGGTLKLSDDRQGGQAATSTRSATMYALTPRLISYTSSPTLAILPLVDVRYFWQFMDLGGTPVTASTTWAGLISQIGAQTGQTINAAAVPSNYFQPDPLEFNRAYANIGQVLDAVAASLGRRLVYDLFAGKFTLQQASDAEAAWNAYDTSKYDVLVGGHSTFRGECPTLVRTSFAPHVGHLALGSGGGYSVASTAAGNGLTADQPGGEWEIFSTAAADLTGLATDGSATPNNSTNLTALGNQIGGDFYAWLKRAYDWSVIGLWPFSPAGYEDYESMHFGSLDAAGRYQCHTRIATLPPAVGPATNWCQAAPSAVQLWPGPRLRVQLAGTLSGGGSVACYPREWNGSALANDANTITVYDAIGTLAGSGGNNAVAEWNPDAARWEFLELPQGGTPTAAAIFTALQGLSGYSAGTPQSLLTTGGGSGNALGWAAPASGSAVAFGSLWGGSTSPPSDGGTMLFAHADAGGSGVAASASSGKITITAVGKWRIRATVEFQATPTGVDFSFLCPSFDLYQDGSAINKDASGAVWSAGALVISGLGSGFNPYNSSLGTAATATLEWEITTTSTAATSLWLVVHLPNDGGTPVGASAAHGNASLMVEQIG